MNEKFMLRDGEKEMQSTRVSPRSGCSVVFPQHVSAQGCVGRRSLLAPASLLVYSNCKFFVEFFFSINLRRMSELSRDCRVGDDVNSLVVNLFMSFN